MTAPEQISPQNHFHLQDKLYSFPYHYLPDLEHGRYIRLHRDLNWGLEYMTYMTFVTELVRSWRPMSLLDVGCGDGRLISLVKEAVADVHGIDLSKKAIAFAKAFNPTATLTCGDLSSLSNQYPAVTLVEVMEHLPDTAIQEFIYGLSRVVQDGGRLLISVPTANVPLNKKHFRHYTLPLLTQQLEPCFRVEEHWWLYRRCATARFITWLLCNNTFSLNHRRVRGLLWKLHRRKSYFADAGSGAHLVCVARPK